MRKSRKPSAFGAALAATNRLFDSIDEELDLPENREEWDAEDYEDERDAVGRKLVELSGRMARLRGRLRTTARQRDHFRGAGNGPPQRLMPPQRPMPPQRVQSALTANIAIQTAPGTQAVVIPLESGVYLVAEASSHTLQGVGAEKVSKALENAAHNNLMFGPGGSRKHWTEAL